MIKTGVLKNRDKIGANQQVVMCIQWEDLKKKFAKRLGLSIIQKEEDI
jgi:hypothetical protein